MEKIMKKETISLILIIVAITVTVVCIVGVIIKSSEPPPVTPTPSSTVPPWMRELDKEIEPKFEWVEIKLGERALVKGNLIKLISIEEEKGVVKIEVQNETTGEPMVVPVKFYGEAFKYKNIAIMPLSDTIEDDRITFLIAEVAKRDEE
jgi:hypothetical protein